MFQHGVLELHCINILISENITREHNGREFVFKVDRRIFSSPARINFHDLI